MYKKSCILLKTYLAVMIICALLLFPERQGAFAESISKTNFVAHEEEVRRLFDEGDRFFHSLPQDPQALDKGIESYKKILELDPQNVEAAWRIAENFYMKSQGFKDFTQRGTLYDQCLIWAKKTVSLDPQSPQGHFYIGSALAGIAQVRRGLSALDAVRKSIIELETAISVAPSGPYATLARVVLGAIYMEMPWPLQDMDRAFAELESAIEADPNLTVGFLQLAKTYLRVKNVDMAKRQLHRCLAIETPTYPPDAHAFDWPKAKKLLQFIEETSKDS